jgi:hypothetical protein
MDKVEKSSDSGTKAGNIRYQMDMQAYECGSNVFLL